MSLTAFIADDTPTETVEQIDHVRAFTATVTTMRRRGPQTAGRLLSQIQAGRGGRFFVRVRPEAEAPFPPRPDSARGPSTIATDHHASMRPGYVDPGFGIGLGFGSSSDMYLDLARFPRSPRAPFPPDEVLFHELVHALAGMYGLLDYTPTSHTSAVGAGFEFHTMNEFVAITFTNMYRAEARSPHLRYDHDPWCHRQRLDWPIDPSLPPDARAAAETRLLTNLAFSWAGRDGGFMSFMAALPLTFNPFQIYLDGRPSRVPRPGFHLARGPRC